MTRETTRAMTTASGRAADAQRAVVVRPVTSDAWRDFVRLFESKGGPHHCWCTAYRVRDSRSLDKAEKKSVMDALVHDATPIGVLAYLGEEPVGWCSVAPRETYVRLERSRTMPRVTLPATSTWTLLCLFVSRPHRRQGVAHALLAGAVAYAREQGAEVVEGYPFDTAGISSTHRGHSRLFEAAGFRKDGKRWARTFR
jgi:GNAT superfamily N-acetyltransferase